jgi:hypothetical protein
VTAQWCDEYRPDRLAGDAGGLGKPYVEEWNRRYAGKTLKEIEAIVALRDGLPAKPVKVGPNDYCMPRMLNAEKTEKLAGIKFVNNELCAPRVFLCQPACAPLTEELLVHAWADETRQKEKAGSPNHCCDTLLYGEKTHMAYLNEAPTPRKKTLREMEPGSDEYDDEQDQEFARRQQQEWWDQ